VSLWEVHHLPGSNSQELGIYRGSVLGNDAVIVARELREHGLPATCCLLDATSADVALIKSRLPESAVRVIHEEEGDLTRSLCLEGAEGQRSWIFSRRIEPHGEVCRPDARLVYIDYYPELAEFLDKSFEEIDPNLYELFVNLSLLRDLGDFPPLRLRPSVVQASVNAAITTEKCLDVAARLIRHTGARAAFVTLGHRGAVMAVGTHVWHCAPRLAGVKRTLGAGAVFSSRVIVGMLRGLTCSELLEFSVRQTAARLQSWQECDEDLRP
jgi:hypothetical protein